MSEPILYLDGRVAVHAGDCGEVVRSLADNSIDACVTDPPYALTSTTKRWADSPRTEATMPKVGVYARGTAGFMGCKWDNGSTAFSVDFWAEVWRVLKPGAHIVAFGGTRTYHRLACAIEDAGFECRDAVMWHYGTGFPKSHDVSKGIDKAAGAVRTKVRHAPRPETSGTMAGSSDTRPWIEASRERGYHEVDSNEASTAEAREWGGWGTALKPSTEIIFVGRKPLSEGTVAANVLKWNCGALNIDACRVGIEGGTKSGHAKADSRGTFGDGLNSVGAFEVISIDKGRWPANLVLSWPEDEYALRRDITAEQKRELFGWLSENA